MSNTKISQLTLADALTGDEVLPIVQTGSTRKTTVQDIADLAGAGGDGIYGGSGQLPSDVIVDLNGSQISFEKNGDTFLHLDPTTNSENSTLRAHNQTDNRASLNVNASNLNAGFDQTANHDSSGNNARIVGFADNTGATLAYTVTTHTFNGNVGIGVTPTALVEVSDGLQDLLNIDKVNFSAVLKATDQTATSFLSLAGNLGGSSVNFDLISADGTHLVEIFGDPVAQTITLTANKTNISNILNLAVGTDASPADGDIWFASNTNTGLKIRVNGITKTVTLT